MNLLNSETLIIHINVKKYGKSTFLLFHFLCEALISRVLLDIQYTHIKYIFQKN